MVWLQLEAVTVEAQRRQHLSLTLQAVALNRPRSGRQAQIMALLEEARLW